MRFLYLMLCISISLVYLKINAEDKDLKTSVIVPCHYKHVKYLNNLLKSYEKQTKLPEEIVISISESYLVSNLTKRLQLSKWKFPVRFCLSNEKLTAGQNRNIAANHSKYDLLVCQDADDLPHPQRIEFIKYFFKVLDIDHLLHYWASSTLLFPILISDISKVKYTYCPTWNEIWKMGPIQMGNPCIRRKVFNKLRWQKEKAEDYYFTYNVYKSPLKRVIVEFPLYLYRLNLTVNN